MHVLRSFLFAPGNRPRILEKVGHCGADAVILDLEDAVPIAEKEATFWFEIKSSSKQYQC